MIARIRNAWLRRGLLMVVVVPVGAFIVFMAMLEALADEVSDLAPRIRATWKGDGQ